MNGTGTMGRQGPGGELRITVYADPGHAWGAVPVRLLVSFGIEREISTCSYLDAPKGMAYLEEDRDLPRLVRAARERGLRVVWDERHTDGACFVRRLPRYQAAAVTGER